MVEAARSASRSKDNYLAAQYARLKGRRGDGKAVVAVAHSMLVIVYHVLGRHQPYRDLGASYFLDRKSDAHRNRLIRQLQRLGYEVSLTPAA
jgi:transposase